MRGYSYFGTPLTALLMLLILGIPMKGEPSALGLDGKRIELFGDSSKEVLVVLFVAVECPISNRFAPAVNRIYDEFSSNSFEMWTVYTDEQFTMDEMRTHRSDYQYRMPALVDFERKLAKYCGATVTPEAVVYIREKSGSYRMVYRGRVNNQYVDFGKWRLMPTKQDLFEVLASIRNGNRDEMVYTETEAIGCYIGE